MVCACSRSAVITALVVSLVLCSTIRSDAQSAAGSIDDDLRRIEKLRQQGQHVAAAAYCQGKLRAAAARPEWRVRYAVEWIRTLAEQGWQLPPEQAESYWNDALSVAQRYASDHADDPRRVLVQVQHGLVYAARGRWHKRQQTLVVSPEYADALADLRRATRRMQEIDQQLASVSGNAASLGLAPTERTALRNHVRHHVARAYLEMAECFPVDSADRINACSRGLYFLRQIPEQQLAASRVWDWYLAQIRAHVLMQRHQTAEQWIDQTLDQKPPLDQRWLAEAERARCRLNEGRAAEGLSALDALPRSKVDSAVAAELEYVKLGCLVALWRQAREEDGDVPAATWQQRAVAQLDRIQELQRDYWFRRAELMVARAVAQGGAEDETGHLLKRTADSYYRQGELDEAASTYQQAAERAAVAGHEESALEMIRLAAAVHQQQGNLGLAVTELRAAALRFSGQPQAAETHWLATLGQAERLRTSRQRPGSRDQANKTYQTMLAEHLEHWPQSHSAIEAHVWSARRAQEYRQWDAAIGHCQFVLRQQPHRADTLLVLGQCYRDWLDQLRASGEGTTDLARRASNQLSEYGDGLRSDTTEALLSPLELIRAEIEIRYLPALRDPAAERVQRLLDAWKPQPDGSAGEAVTGNWQRSAQMLMLERQSLAGDWDGAQAAAMALGPLELSTVLRLASLLEDSLQAGQVDELGQLQSQILQQVDSKTAIAETDQNQLHRWQARALVRMGQLDEAHAILAQLAKRLPDDGAIQEEYAKVLATQGDHDAIGQWRRVLGKSRPATARWFRAKYAIAELHYTMGDRKRAAQMIRLLRTLHPDLGGADSQARFEALLHRCEL